MFIKPPDKIGDWLCRLRFRQQIVRALDGALETRAQARLEGHLKTCQRCRLRYDRQVFASRLVSRYALPDQPPAGKPQWTPHTGLPETGRQPQGQFWTPQTVKWLGAAIVTVLLIFIAAGLGWRYFQAPAVSWEIVRLAGEPKINQRLLRRADKLALGETVETDSESRAMLQVGTLGQVEIDSNTRLRFLNASPNNHRLALEHGKIYATILAPPQEFFVETPSAIAVDLGCAYSLEVNEAGESILFVSSGWVALRLDGRESLVPAGSLCKTRRGSGPGTPYFADATKSFIAALESFDFENGKAEALNLILSQARARDSLTLWHLLWRVESDERLTVYERLALLAPPPDGVTPAGVLNLNQEMLNLWREQIEYLSVGIDPAKAPTATGSVKPVGAMIDARFNHTATLLSDGRVLIAGGRENQGKVLNTAEIYDPATGQFIPTGQMLSRRVGHTATRLANGKVLLAGGSDSDFFYGALASAELYDPATCSFAPTGQMSVKRLAHKATLLKNGRVLLTGGQSEDWANHDSTEIYDPESGTFTPAARMQERRADHTATLLADGRVLITGGSDARHSPIQVSATAEIYDPEKDRCTATGRMSVVRFKHSAEGLPDGRIILIGGSNVMMWDGRYASAEIFDPATGRFTQTGRLNAARYKIRDAVVALHNGNILVAGGGRAEVYDPATGLFGAVKGGMGTTRYYATATLLPSGEVLIVGGYSAESGNMPANASAWLYQPE